MASFRRVATSELDPRPSRRVWAGRLLACGRPWRRVPSACFHVAEQHGNSKLLEESNAVKSMAGSHLASSAVRQVRAAVRPSGSETPTGPASCAWTSRRLHHVNTKADGDKDARRLVAAAQFWTSHAIHVIFLVLDLGTAPIPVLTP